MRRAGLLLAASIGVALTAALVTHDAFAPDAVAKTKNNQGRTVVRFPSDELPDENALIGALQRSTVPTTIIMEKGKYDFSQLFVFQRSNVIVCGATGRASDVVIEAAGAGLGNGRNAAVFIQQSSHITFRDLTIKAGDPTGQAIYMDAALVDTNLSSFCDNVTLEGCRLEGGTPIFGSAAVRALTVTNCRLNVTATDGVGLFWGDGDTLLVTKTKITADGGTEPLAAILVTGASAVLSEGERAAKIVLTRNRIEGQFGRGIDLADVVEVRVRKNRISITGDRIRPGTAATQQQAIGRTGIFIRRQDATALPDDYEVRKNRVRGVFYAVQLAFANEGVVANNDLRRNGINDVDPQLGEAGGAMKVQLVGAVCRTSIAKNDMRNLRSPKTVFDGSDIVDVPAVVVILPQLAGLCFSDGDAGNRTSKGRLLFVGDDQ